ncbi:DUF6443 domain-containing protein [Flavobacterium sp. N3904]|uniref:DUF6443 domain-containing protein n=1 Tax=Flavobacterium sp. N3904 TaxID=2986835 RepID=UPI002224FE33|nr:DUF6443 domain-containing protein [Flavobacterium sp. N3904]
MNKILFFSVLFLYSFFGYAQVETPNEELQPNKNISLLIVDPGEGGGTAWYLDHDKDGWGNIDTELYAIIQPADYVANSLDRDDNNANITNIAPQTFYRDADGDTFGNAAVTIYYSVKPATGYATNNTDCNDGDKTLNPNTVWYLDSDKDSFGISNVTTNKTQCVNPSVAGGVQYVRNSNDCNDGDATLNPNTVWYLDSDKDSFGISNVTTNKTQCANPSVAGGVQYVRNSNDCNDGDATLNPNTVWYLDSDKDSYGISNVTTNKTQCVNPSVAGGVQYVRNSNDCNDGDATLTPNTVWYLDSDKDSFGISNVTTNKTQCANPSVAGGVQYVRNATDCNDGDATLTPNTVWYLDSDKDSFGISNVTTNKTQCVNPSVAGGVQYVRNSNDCNDGDSTLNPNTVWYLDSDKDSFGISNVTTNKTQCANPSVAGGVQYVRNSNDCNDGDATLNPNTVWYLDSDKDSFGISNVTTNKTQCANPSVAGGVQYVRSSNDCNDGDATLNPNTVWYLDSDKDSFGISNVTTNKTQCTNPSVAGGVQYVRNSNDCNDGDATLTPNTVWYLDSDKDSFGISNVTTNKTQCANPSVAGGVQYVRNSTDCNDAAATVNPNTKWYADADADGLGDPASFLQQCTNPGGSYVLDNTDNCPLVSGSIANCENIKAPSLDHNYVITSTYKKATTTVYENPDPTQAQVNITYFDGLGRPMQQIANQQSNSGKDIITHIEYDPFGRQIRDYLPFVSTASNMVFDPNALTNTSSYYDTAIYDNTDNPFSEKKLESSPLNKVLKQAAPGADWAMDAGHEIKLDYQTNTETEVKLYKATATGPTSGLYEPIFSDGGNYSANELYKTITYDENSIANPSSTDEKLGSTVEFKNKEGQVVLKRTYESSTKHDTYYVYDQFGNLTYVLPPLVSNPSAELDGLCYQYKYDSRNRLAEKKLPGKQWEFIVYDKLDRPVATGPAKSPFKNDTAVGWLVTKYDAFGRPVYTGWLNAAASSATRSSMQVAQNNSSNLFESKKTNAVIDLIPAFYTTDTAPTGIKLLTVNYYDTYDFPNADVSSTVLGQTVLANTKTLATGSWTRAVTTPSSIAGETTTIYYDAKARPIRSAVTNYLTGYTNTDSELDAFSGQLKSTITKHKRTGAPADVEIVVKEVFDYSPQGRLRTHTHKIGTAVVEQLLADNTYDELGQLTCKKVGNTSSVPLQKVDYSYNIRGWMTGINNDPTNNLVLNTTEKDLFGFKINYNTVKNETGYTGKELYNGNISETYWRTSSDNVLRKYGYKYDNLNRLKNAIFQKPGNANPVPQSYDENLTYDQNGNIRTLVRFGDMEGALPPNGIDNLIYTYQTNSNMLLNVLDNSNNNISGFVDGNKSGDDYTYDANGNLITDKNKNITAIVYNQLNLPTKITFGTTGTIEYIYNAAGQKLEKIVTQGTTVTSTNYLGGFQYTKPHLGTWTLQFFPTAEGYIKNTVVNSANTYSYVFNYTDHLGNVRLSYSDADKNGVIVSSEILDESHYYPFGLKHIGYVTALGTDNKYKFNGKELQDELGLNMYDYGARNYDPALGRWMNIDPLAEKYFGATPYNYVLDNPVNAIDPDGMDIYLLTESGRTILALKEKDKKTDTMYAVKNSSITDITSSSGTKDTTSIFDMKDTNGDGQFTKDDGVTVKSGLIGQMVNSSGKIDGQDYYSSKSEYSKENEDAYLNLFKYASDNSNAEFGLHTYNDKGNTMMRFVTKADTGAVFSPNAFGILNSDVIYSYHSHPGIRTYRSVEEFSIQGNTGDSDYGHSYYQKRNYPNYIYFPNSSRLYNVTPTTINYIKRINNPKDLKK